MSEIHVIAKDRAGLEYDKETGKYRSGDWVVADGTAEKLIGGKIYLHDAQGKGSYFGGTIIDVVNVAGDRKVFIFEAEEECKGVLTDGWGQEKKITLD